MLKHSVFLLFLCFSFSVFSQEVISSGGDFQTSNSLMVSSTIGEPIIETLSNNGVILTQGFQQSKLTIVGIKNLNQQITATVFPNPTTSSIILKIKDAQNLFYDLQTSTGKILSHSTINQNVTEIVLADLPANLYFLRLFSQDGKVSQIIKIQKLN